MVLLDQEEYQVEVPALSAVKIAEKDYSSLVVGLEEKTFIEAVFTDEEGNQSKEVVFFVPYKHLVLDQPEITCEVSEAEDKYKINLRANCLACFVELDFPDCDALFSDNYFHITEYNPKGIELKKEDITGAPITDAKELKEKLQIRSLRDTYEY